ncbi:MAG: FtsW/RodA/SpoVE family cell cycle protein [Planctomycetota bacterium]|nr:FtsW/RodA/SpoVE family cell cycle protein [Planctomycetota bacterium]
MINFRRRARELLTPNIGWLVLAAAIGLTFIGISAISTAEAMSVTHYARQQAVWLAIALCVAVGCTLIDPRVITQAAFPLLGLSILLEIVLVLPFMPRSMVEARNGARSWLHFGPISFEPSELAKIAFVLSLAQYLRFRENYRTLSGLLVPFAIMFVPVGLILKQPDLGTSLLFAPTLFAVLVAAGARMRHMMTLLGLAALAVAINVVVIYKFPPSMQILKPHQQSRIKAVISQAYGDTRYIKDIGYQQYKATVLVGSGQLTGFGADRAATIVRYNRLPEDHNDMIFAVIAARWGLVGGIVTLLLYLLLVLSFLLVAMHYRNPFTRLATVGFAAMIFSQATINIGMTLGLMPITGITLPFVSYGGSSLVMSYAVVGLVVNFASRPKAIVARPSFEFDHADAMFQ